MLRVVRGEPTAEEVAALVALVACSGTSPDESEFATPTSQWAPPGRLLGPAVAPSSWWESALPR